MDNRNHIGYALLAFGILHAYSFFPEDKYYDFFLLNFPDKYTGEMKNLPLSPAHYIDYLGVRVLLVLYYYREWKRYSGKLLLVVTCMFAGYALDYCLIANQPFAFYRLDPFILPLSYSWACAFALLIVWMQYLWFDFKNWINGER